MKANEFVKKFGWEEANSFVNWYGGKTSFKFLKVKEQTISVHSGDQPYDFHIDALKRLVESHRLIEVEGGIDQVKDTFIFAYKHGADELTEYGKRLKQAIFDVESCQ